MDSGRQFGPSRGTWQFSAYEIPALIMLLALSALTVLALTHPGSMQLTRSGVLGGAITTASLLIAVGAAYVALSEFLLYGSLSSLWIGLAFLVFVSSHVGMRLVPLLAGWEHHINWAPFGWEIEDTIAGALLLMAALLVERVVSIARRVRNIMTGVLATGLIVLLITVWIYHAGSQSIPLGAATTVAVVGAVVFFSASVQFWRASKWLGRPWYFWLSLSLALAGFSQIQYAIRQYPVTVVQPGDILRLVFFAGILFALAAEWSQNYRRLRWQARELSALHALTVAPSIDNVSAVVHHVERVASETLQADVRILMRDRADTGDSPVSLLSAEADGALAPTSSEGDTQSADGESTASMVLLGVPLRTPQRRLGLLLASRQSGDEFSTYDVRLLRAYGAQASILLERSLLYEEVAAGAILQERSRLAREIHDGLAQHLAFLKMRVAWLRRAPSSVSARQLQEVEAVLETALIEARHAITTLRSELQSASCAEAIARYAEEFGQVSGLQVMVTGDEHVPEVGPKTRVELLRVVQEALNNVRKHAHANNIWIELKADQRGIEVMIRDDGTGFSSLQSEQGHFGLEIMRERAESVGGQLLLASTPNSGTEVRVWVPSRDMASEETLPESLGLAER